ncbi:MAG: GldG family protein [Verrucomicrobia bacterium]|nr:GldG family protein [Verrucomicrobiota bacterium]
MGDEAIPPFSFSPARRWRIGFHVALASAATFSLVLMANYLAARHFKQMEWTADPQGNLSPVTLRVLSSLTNQVKVVVFYDRRGTLYSAITRLLNQFQSRCPKLEVEYVDYTIAPRAEQVRASYQLDDAEKGDLVIFSSGGKKKIVSARELAEYDYSGVFTERKVKLTKFKGELLFTSAICSVVDPRPARAYFLEGHREYDPREAEDQRGYLEFASVLQENNITVAPLTLLTNDIPADCQLLVIANPLNPIAEEELEKIEKYLALGGRLLALFSLHSIPTQTGLEKLLANWGVEVGRDWVTDSAQSKSDQPSHVVVTEFEDHPIVRPLRRSRLVLAFPRSVSRRASTPRSVDAPRVTELASTSPAGVLYKPPRKVADRKGRIPLMAAVEKGSIEGITADRGVTRIVVVGESLFWANKVIDLEANRDFARLVVNWLINRETLLNGIGPRPIKEYTITMTRVEMKTIQWLLVAVLPGSVLCVGVLVWARRRS